MARRRARLRSTPDEFAARRQLPIARRGVPDANSPHRRRELPGISSIRVTTLAAALGAERRRLQQGFEQSRKPLLQIKIRVALPAAIHVQFPMNAGQRRANQAVIHLLRHAPARGVDALPARIEGGQRSALFRDGSRRPIPWTGGMLEAGNIIRGKGLIPGAPSPEITGKVRREFGDSRKA